MEAATPTLFQMHADLTAVDQDAEMVSVTLMSNAILVLTLHSAKTALSDVVMESWNLVKSATMEFTTLTQWQMVAEPTAVFHLAVMEYLMLSRNVTMELPTRILQTAAELGAVFPSAVMVLLIPEERSLVTMEILSMEMVVIHAASLSAEMDVLILVNNAMLEPVTLIPCQDAAVPTAHSQLAEMVLPISERNVITEETTPSDQTHADLTVPCQNVVTELLTIFTERFVITDQETRGQPLMDAPQLAHQTFAVKVLLLTQLSTLPTGFQNKLECTTTKVLTLMLLILRTSITLSLLPLRQSLLASWLNSERF